ncbi:MAG: NAD(P)-binding domain-containing protein, partial [Polyangiales bacterium]
MAKIAFLGAGLIGSGMIESARRRGDEVTVWNRTAEKARALATFGALVAESADAAVRGASRVHLALTDDAAVDAVLAGTVAAIGSDAMVIDHTTTLPAGTAARAKRLADSGRAFLHAPVFMSPQMCRESKGLMLCAGPSGAHERVAADLAGMTGEVWYLGERPDLAAAYKVFGNAMIITITAGLADVFTMGKALDLEPEQVHALFSKFKPAGTIDIRGAKMARGDYSPSFELTMARKDVRLMLET